MSDSTVSSKYQIVIPKDLRNQLGIKPGQRVHLSAGKNGTIIVDVSSRVEKLAGKYTGLWGEDSSQYVKELREEWEAHQRKLDDRP